MTHWKKSDITDLFKDLDCDVEEVDCMKGHYTCPALYFTPKGTDEWISVMPFVTEPEGLKDIYDDREVEFVEVRTDGDDSGGVQTTDEKVGSTYGIICARLMKKGFSVVDTYEGFF